MFIDLTTILNFNNISYYIFSVFLIKNVALENIRDLFQKH